MDTGARLGAPTPAGTQESTPPVLARSLQARPPTAEEGGERGQGQDGKVSWILMHGLRLCSSNIPRRQATLPLPSGPRNSPPRAGRLLPRLRTARGAHAVPSATSRAGFPNTVRVAGAGGQSPSVLGLPPSPCTPPPPPTHAPQELEFYPPQCPALLVYSGSDKDDASSPPAATWNRRPLWREAPMTRPGRFPAHGP